MNAKEYYRQIARLVSETPAIADSEITFREIDENECYIKAILRFGSGYSLHVAEYVTLQDETIARVKYRYELLDTSQHHVWRWDNAPHHREVETFPFHQHDTQDRVTSSRAVSFSQVIAISLGIIENES